MEALERARIGGKGSCAKPELALTQRPGIQLLPRQQQLSPKSGSSAQSLSGHRASQVPDSAPTKPFLALSQLPVSYKHMQKQSRPRAQSRARLEITTPRSVPCMPRPSDLAARGRCISFTPPFSNSAPSTCIISFSIVSHR